MNSPGSFEDATPEGAENLSEPASVFSFGAAMASGLSDTCQWRGKEAILLVEDEALVRKATAEVLQSAGYQVFIADNAAHALEIYRESSKPVDLLLTDVVMPGVSGRELAQTFSLLCPQVRIMLMSGYMEQLRLFRIASYRKEYLAKPFSVSTLLQRVREVLDKNPFDFGTAA